MPKFIGPYQIIRQVVASSRCACRCRPSPILARPAKCTQLDNATTSPSPPTRIALRWDRHSRRSNARPSPAASRTTPSPAASRRSPSTSTARTSLLAEAPAPRSCSSSQRLYSRTSPSPEPRQNPCRFTLDTTATTPSTTTTAKAHPTAPSPLAPLTHPCRNPPPSFYSQPASSVAQQPIRRRFVAR